MYCGFLIIILVLLLDRHWGWYPNEHHNLSSLRVNSPVVSSVYHAWCISGQQYLSCMVDEWGYGKGMYVHGHYQGITLCRPFCGSNLIAARYEQSDWDSVGPC